MGCSWLKPPSGFVVFAEKKGNNMLKSTQKSAARYEEEEDLLFEQDDDMYEDNDEDLSYMVYKYKKALIQKKERGELPPHQADIEYNVYRYKKYLVQKKREDEEKSQKRQKGRHPSSEHYTHYGPRPRRPFPPFQEDDVLADPDFLPVDEEDMSSSSGGRWRVDSSRGRGGVAPRTRGRPRGSTSRGGVRGTRGTRGTRGSRGGTPSSRGSSRRGRGGNSADVSTASSSEPTLKKWKPVELKALIWGANHLKPVLKGKFKASADGRTMKKLAWEELAEYVESIGHREWKVKQCKDKLLYYSQDAKRKRQDIDNRFKTGSGQRREGDYLTEMEEAILDWVGEDVVLGIPGMQPPNLKGGGRTSQAWSCYDPSRDNREDYADLGMPSDALKAVQEGDMLAVDEEGDPLMDEDDYNEPVPEEDPLQAVDHFDGGDEGFLEQASVPPQPDKSRQDDDDVHSPAPASVTRQTMLRMNKAENEKRKGIAAKRKPEEDDLSPHAREKVERKKILLAQANRLVEKYTPKKTGASVTRPVRPSTSTITSNPALPSRKQRPALGLKLQPDTGGKTQQSAPQNTRKRLPSFSEIIDDADMSGVAAVDSPVFKTSTPSNNMREEQHISPQKSMTSTAREHRDPDPQADTSDSKRRKLFDQNQDCSLPSLGDTSPHKQDTRSEMRAATSAQMEETRKIIEEHSRSLCEALMKHQDELAQNTQEISTIMVKSLKGVSNGMITALRDHSHETSRCLREQRDSMMAAQEKYLEQQRKEAEEDCLALGNVHTELSNTIVTKQVQLVKALHRLSDIMVENSEKVSDAQSKLNIGFLGMQDCVTTLTQSFNNLMITADHLQKRSTTGMKTAETADQILKEVTSTVHKLNQAVTYSFDHKLIRAPYVVTVGTTVEEELLQEPVRVPQGGTEGGENPICVPTPESSGPSLIPFNPSGVGVYLTHPYTPGEGEVANYRTTEHVLEASTSLIENGTGPTFIPSAAICQEATESNDGLGLPTFQVKSSEEVIIVRSPSDVQDIEQGKNLEEGGFLNNAEGETGHVREEEPEGPTSGGICDPTGLEEENKEAAEEVEGRGPGEDDVKSAGGVDGSEDGGSTSERDETQPRKSVRLRIKKTLADFQM